MTSLYKIAVLIVLILSPVTARGIIGGFDYAEKLFQDGFYDLAVEEYKTFINENPQDRRVEGAYEKLIASYYHLEKWNMVLTEGNRFLQRYDKSQGMGDILFYIASALDESGMKKQALETAEKVRRFYKGTPLYTDNLFLAAALYREEGLDDEYVKAMQEVINLNPRGENLKKAYLSLLDYSYSRGEMEKAGRYLDKLDEKDLDPGKWLWYKADVAFGLGKYDQALREYQGLMSRYPESEYYYRALYGKGRVLMEKKAFTEAAAAFQSLLDKNPNSTMADDALKGKAEALLALDRREEAAKEIDYFMKAYGESPLYPDVVRMALEIEKEKRGWDEKAIAALFDQLAGFYRSRQSESDVKRVLLEKASVFEDGGFHAQAVNAFLDFITFFPRDTQVPYLVFRVGRLYAYEMKDYERAIAAFERISFNTEGYGDKALYETGLCYEKIPRYDRAVTAYKNIGERFPFSPLADKARKRIDYLQRYIIADVARGLTALDGLLEKQMTGPVGAQELYRQRGDIFFSVKDFSKAYDYYQKGGRDDEKALQAGAYALLLKKGPKSEIESFFNARKDHPAAGEVYSQVLVYYDMEGTLEEEDFLYAFSHFPDSVSQETVRNYIDFLISEEREDALKTLVLPPSVAGTPAEEYARAMAAYVNANFGEAERLFSDLLGQGGEETGSLSYYLAAIYHKTGRNAEARERLLSISRPFELKVKASLLLARIAFSEGDYKDVIFNIFNVLNRLPEYYNDPDVMDLYLEALIIDGQKDAARKACMMITADTGELAVVKGLACLKLGMDEESMDLLKKAQGREVRARVYKALADQERWQDVLEFFRGDDAYSVSRRVIALTRLNRLDEGLALQRKNSKGLREFKEEISYVLGEYTYLKKKDADRAADYFTEAGGTKEVLDTPWSLQAAFMLGNIRLGQGEADKALDVFERLEANPSFEGKEKLFLSLGQAWYALGDKEKAVDYFQRSYAFKPNPDALYNQGLLFKQEGESGQAREAFQQIVDRFPESSLYYGAYLNIVYTFMDERKYDDALGRLTSFIDRAPDSLKMEVQYNIGDCYYARGQYRDAIREFMKVKYLPVNTDEDFQWMVTALFQGGTAYESLGEMDKAVEIYEYIIQISGRETVYSKTAASRIQEIRRH